MIKEGELHCNLLLLFFNKTIIQGEMFDTDSLGVECLSGLIKTYYHRGSIQPLKDFTITEVLN